MARAARKRTSKKRALVEDIYFRTDSAYLCVIINRRTKLARVIDFRVGALPAKRMYLQKLAKEEGIEKIITLVEKDEVTTWTRIGFAREGVVPGFYKRSDGHLCGWVVGSSGGGDLPNSADERLADRTINAAKKLALEIPEQLSGVSCHPAEPEAALAARDGIWRRDKALGAFDEFGRDAQRKYIETAYRKSKTNYISAEYQDCFGHSLLEILRRPASQEDQLAIVGGLRDICGTLTERGIVSAFSFAPSDDVELSTAFVAAGFRKTGLLALGILVSGERRDAILWSRKLANPAGDDNSDSSS